MKELTIEEKAQAYDKALERAKRLHCEPTGGTERIVCEQIFPELKESEDELKWLTAFIRKEVYYLSMDIRDDEDRIKLKNLQKSLAWLEKQGEHANFLSKIQVGDKVTRNEGGVLVNISQLERVAKPRRIKPADKVEPKFKVKYAGSEYNVLEVKDIAGVTYYGIEDEPNHIDYVKAENCDIISGYAIKENGSPYPTKPAVFSGQKPQGKTALEAAKEEKVDNSNSADGVPFDYENAYIPQKDFASKQEPKFHEGEWIIHQGTENIYQVVAVIDNQYQLKYGNNYTVQKCSDVDESARLWTIQDAKDGDVLFNGKIIVIFKHFEDPSYRQHIIAYIGLDINGNIQISNGIWTLGIDKAKPATKEQRDLLFQKMKEAGYKWDTEKKELKKIEDEIEIPFGAKDSELQEVTYYIPKGFHAEIDDDKVVIKKGEKPVEWSEEDEKNLQGIIDEIHANRNAGPDYDINTYDRFLDWLKSLKQRIGG